MKAWTFLCLLMAPAPAAEWFVAPNGKPAGDGSKAAPWDLATALGQPQVVKAGDTIWVSGGTYQGGFTSTLQGSRDAPVTVRAMAGQRVTVDCKPRDARDSGLFSVEGTRTNFHGLEFTCSDPKRVTQEKGSWPADIRRGGISSRGSHINFMSGITWTGNTLIAPGTLATFEYPPEGTAAEYQWEDNTWLRTKVEWAAFNITRNQKNEGATFAEWQKKTGFDAHSRYAEGPPQGSRIIVRPNQYEKGRAHVIVYDWDRKGAVAVDLKDVLPPGQEYRVVSAQNFYGEPVLSGAWDGRPLQLPMRPDKAVPPVGMPDYQLPVTGPEFGVFVVLPVDKDS